MKKNEKNVGLLEESFITVFGLAFLSGYIAFRLFSRSKFGLAIVFSFVCLGGLFWALSDPRLKVVVRNIRSRVK